MFYGTGLSPCILILRNQKPDAHRNKVLMIDGTRVYTQKRAQNILSEDDIDELFRLYESYHQEEEKSIVVSMEQLAEKGFDLYPNRYVHYHKAEEKPYSVVLNEFKAAYQNMVQAEKSFQDLLNDGTI